MKYHKCASGVDDKDDVSAPRAAFKICRHELLASSSLTVYIPEIMKQLWTPWRMEYILEPKPDSCVFCLPQTTEEDEERLILSRGAFSFVLMNKYPYNNGHIMVCPYRHLMDITDLSPEESTEIMEQLKRCAHILRRHFRCEGINIGLNLGQAAGAGIREHLHFHLVPRWNGDSSFMAVLADVRTVPEHLRQTHKELRRCFIYEHKEATDNMLTV